MLEAFGGAAERDCGDPDRRQAWVELTGRRLGGGPRAEAGRSFAELRSAQSTTNSRPSSSTGTRVISRGGGGSVAGFAPTLGKDFFTSEAPPTALLEAYDFPSSLETGENPGSRGKNPEWRRATMQE